MRPKVRAALAVLDEVLAKNDRDSQALWNILTSLRGPDGRTELGDEAKRTFTDHVRALAFPTTAAGSRNLANPADPNGFANGASFSKVARLPVMTLENFLRKAVGDRENWAYHWSYHMAWAITALDDRID